MVSIAWSREEGVAVHGGQGGGEHRPHELPDGGAQRRVAAGERVAQFAGHAVGAERLGAGDAVGVQEERGGPARGELCDPAQRVGVVERVLEFGVEDGVGVAGLVAAGVADRLLALLVGPAGAEGDHVAVVGGEQVADDRLERLKLAGRGVHETGAQVVAEPEVAPCRLGLVQPGLLLARLVVVRGLAQLVVLEAGAGEERVFACRRVRVVVVELVVDEVEDEERVDDPDAGGEVGSAVVHEREAPGPRAVADLAGDAQFQRPCPGARGQRVEL